MTMTVGSGKSINFSEGTADVAYIEQTLCSGMSFKLDVNRTIDLFAKDNIELLTDDFCSLTVFFSGPIQLAGQGKGHELSMTLALDSVAASSPGKSPKLILELGGNDWVDADSIGLAEEDVVIDESSTLYSELLEALSLGTTLYMDENGDGVVEEEERDESEED
jgi:hypothetical protein